MNRIGNLIVPNDNYCKFEEWLMPILDKMVEEQKNGTEWTPSKFINRLGKEINDESVSCPKVKYIILCSINYRLHRLYKIIFGSCHLDSI